MQITKSQLLTRIFLVLGILVLVNVLAAEYHYRLDFTADQRYTLSSATEKILKNVDEPITINAYFSKNLPSRVAKAKRYFKDLLVEYRNLSEQELVYKFINPNKSKESEQKAQQKGIQPMLLNTRQRDQLQRQRVYMGAVIKIGNSSEVIPRIQPGGPVEYKLSSSIHKLSQEKKPKVALFQGHGEIQKNDLGRALDDLSVLYNVEEYKLKPSESIPSEYRTGIIANPSDSFAPGTLDRLDEFLANGGNLLLATDRVNAKLNQQMMSLQDIGLADWLSEKGFEIQNNVVIDAQCGAVTVTRQTRAGAFRQQINFPYFPLIQNFNEHPVTQGLNRIFLAFASEVQTTQKKNVNFTVLAETSKKSGTQEVPSRIEVMKQWNNQDFQKSNIPIAVGASGQFGGEQQSRMVVIGSSNLIPKQQNQRRGRSQVREGNANFLVNAVDWLSDQMGLVKLRTQGVTSRPLDELSDQRKNFLKYSNAFAPIVLILIIGFIRYRIQQSKRKRWMAI